MARKLTPFERESAKLIRQIRADQAAAKKKITAREANRKYQARYRQQIAAAKESFNEQEKIERRLRAQLGSNKFSSLVNRYGRNAVDATVKAQAELARIRKSKAAKGRVRRARKLPAELRDQTARQIVQPRQHVTEIPDQIGAVYRKGKKTGWYERRDNAGNVVKKYHGIAAARKARNQIQHASSIRGLRKSLPFLSYRDAAGLLKSARGEARKQIKQVLKSKEFKKLSPAQKRRVRNFLKHQPRAAVRAFLAAQDVHDTF